MRQWLNTRLADATFRERVADAATFTLCAAVVVLITSGTLTDNETVPVPPRAEINCATGELLTWQDKHHGADVCYVTADRP